MDSTTALTAQALELLGVTDPPESYAALLRSSVSTQPIDSTVGLLSVAATASTEAFERPAIAHDRPTRSGWLSRYAATSLPVKPVAP